MAPPLPPKPSKSIGPVVRRTLFAAAIGASACQPKEPARPRTPGPIRIGAAVYDEEPPEELPPDAGALAPPDAGPAAEEPPPPQTDAGTVMVPERPPPIRIGPPVRIDKPDFDREPIRIGAAEDPRSTRIDGVLVDPAGRPVARASVRVELASGARIVTTDAAGAFAIDGIAPGDHDVVVRAQGFAPVQVRLRASREPARATIALR